MWAIFLCHQLCDFMLKIRILIDLFLWLVVVSHLLRCDLKCRSLEKSYNFPEKSRFLRKSLKLLSLTSRSTDDLQKEQWKIVLLKRPLTADFSSQLDMKIYLNYEIYFGFYFRHLNEAPNVNVRRQITAFASFKLLKSNGWGESSLLELLLSQ